MKRHFRLSRLVAVLVACVPLLLTAASYLGSVHWTFDLLAHFRVQYLGLCAILLPVACLLRSKLGWMPIMPLSIALVLNLVSVLPDALPVRSSIAHQGPVFRVLMANVLTQNEDWQSLQRLIHVEDPDVIGLLEIDDRWAAKMRYLRGRYPYHLEDPRQDNFGIGLYSRIPFSDAWLRPLAPETGVAINAVLVRLAFETGDVGLLLAHSLPPVGGQGAAIRNAQLRDIARIRAAHDDLEFIVLGDLNTSPWSPHFKDLIRRSGLRSGARGHGLMPTWPTGLPPLMIPLDHGLISSGLVTLSYRRGPEVGSDHRPIFFDVGFIDGPAFIAR